ncbi:hypothetical protein IWQ57_003398 [Coemansia nantahalensis]|uniref:Uncharacterized protein n=1 Tax=Coemansia nantahalensis TaxID=2789366 RepID=A0ACC1JWB8_9FUNG|nr:hypothetical protein IWQ57_003398 [Coemansia nantahalensis]
MVGNACASAAEIARDGAALLQSSLHRIEPLVGATLDVARAAGASAAEVAHDGAAILQSTLTTLVPLADTTLDVVRAASANAAEVLCKYATLAWSAAQDILPLSGATLDVARAAWTSGADLVCKHTTRVWLWVLSFTFATANEPLSGASQGEVWTAGHGVLLYAMFVVVLGVIVLRMTRAVDKHIDNVCAMERDIAALTRAVQDIVEGRGGAPADLPQDDAE